MLTERQKELFKIIVEEYIDSAKPVGSKAICDRLNVSSATVRAEMSNLEELGLLEKTHISSGRVPSEKGYRYYVDNIMKPKELSGEDVLKLQVVMNNKSLAINDVISQSMEIVAEMTNYTAIVLGKSSQDNLVSKVEVIPIDDKKMVAIVVTDKGHVEHKNIILEGKVSSIDISKTIELINKLIVGTPISEVSSFLEFKIKPIISNYVEQHEVLYNAFYDAFTSFTNKASDVHFAGKNNFLKQPEFNNIEKVKEMLNKFDDIGTISEMEEQNNGINIYIGKESELSDDVSVIKTKYNIAGEEGTIAIIGPKRMEYERVVNLLNYIKENIEDKDNP